MRSRCQLVCMFSSCALRYHVGSFRTANGGLCATETLALPPQLQSAIDFGGLVATTGTFLWYLTGEGYHCLVHVHAVLQYMNMYMPCEGVVSYNNCCRASADS